MSKIKIIWEKNISDFVDSEIERDIEAKLTRYENAILKGFSFIKSLEKDYEEIYPFLDLSISDYGRKGDSEGNFYLVITETDCFIAWKNPYLVSKDKGEIQEKIIAGIEIQNGDK